MFIEGPSDEEPMLRKEAGRRILEYDLQAVHIPEVEKFRLGISYCFAMGMCGLVLVAITSTLDDLADKTKHSFLDSGSVFIARGLGATSGAIASSKLYLWYPGNEVLAASLFMVVVMLIALPSCRSFPLLHFYYFICGLGTAITDTGCQIMTRKVQGNNAGPWLGANTVAFGLCGALVPLMEMFTKRLYETFLSLAFVTLLAVVLVKLLNSSM